MFAVETATTDGMHEVVRIRETDGGGESGRAEGVQLSEAERAEIHTAVRANLDLRGHESGPALTEVMLSETGARVLGCHIGRR